MLGAGESLERACFSRFLSLSVFAFAVTELAMSMSAQGQHLHTPAVSGMAQGIPFFCANPTVTNVATGEWSNRKIWSTGRVPGANDKVAIRAGHTVAYDVASDVKIDCIELHGKLIFKADSDTRLKVVTIEVLEDGALEVGSAARPITPDVTAEIVVADQPFDADVDPAQIGHGIVALGKVTMHGAVKAPTFMRLSDEPRAGQTTLTFERAAAGWKAGDQLVIPDTRQLRDSEHGSNYKSEAERVQIAVVSGPRITLTAPLVYDHRGGRDATGKLEFLPHVGNLTRNVVVRSESPAGTRGHTIFVSHANIDLRYVAFRELGRTKMGILNNTEFDSEGRVARMGTNQIGRYAVHFHHDFGPTGTPENGHQFTVIGSVVDGSAKWGITVHRSHYGLIQDNVVYNTRGAGIVTEDGTESFNVFDHNFSVLTAGSRDAAAGNGYSSTLPNPGGEGSAFWFRGPNNYIRNNVAADAAEAGYGLPVTALGTVRIPKFKGADTSNAPESLQFDTNHAPVLEFSNNEAYGAIQSGVTWAWSGAISTFTVWHASRQGLAATPSEKLAVDHVIARGDASALAAKDENPVGVWISNYAAKTIVLAHLDVQGTRVGVVSPFFYGQAADAGAGSLVVQDSYFRTNIGVNVATAYTDDAKNGIPLKKAVVRGIRFEPIGLNPPGAQPPEAISMNYGMPPGTRPRDPVLVYDFNEQTGNDFKVYASSSEAADVPCHDTMPGIDGWVCK
jgi:hypothetical protein